uniref:AD domain-containing protein n=1 Tax=Pinguiococcus pyrenoidosus TaxID=172671 RepID=A0A7R9U9J2_9STRA
MEAAHDFVLGSRVSVALGDSETIQGEVFSVDALSGTLILRRPAHENTNTSHYVSLVNMARISSVEVLEEGSGELREVSAPSEKDLERKEVKAREAAEKAFRSINFSVSPAGQQMFDMLSKTLPCEWDGESIVVMQQARVNPPYSQRSVVQMEGDQIAMERICRMVADFSKKLAAS